MRLCLDLVSVDLLAQREQLGYDLTVSSDSACAVPGVSPGPVQNYEAHTSSPRYCSDLVNP